jgi:hypothetical protein
MRGLKTVFILIRRGTRPSVLYTFITESVAMSFRLHAVDTATLFLFET